MIYGSNESGKPVLFARLDQQRSCPAFWIVITRTCLDHKAAAQSSATSNINQPFIGSIHVLQRRFVLQMKEKSLFYSTAHNNRPTRKICKDFFLPLVPQSPMSSGPPNPSARARHGLRILFAIRNLIRTFFSYGYGLRIASADFQLAIYRDL